MESSHPTPKQPDAGDFAALARRIGLWTSRGLLCAIVLVAGLAFGRQVLRWWAEDDSSARTTIAALPAERLGDPAAPHEIEFGDLPWSMRRQSIAGDQQRAVERLRTVCRELLEARREPQRPAAAVAGGGPNDANSPTNAVAERFSEKLSVGGRSVAQLLKSLQQDTPVAESPGRWRLYEWHETVPMTVGIAESPPRVILCGMAIPAGPDAWTLCVFHVQGESPIFVDTQIGAVPVFKPHEKGPHAEREEYKAEREEYRIPLPPDARPSLALRATDGGGITAFTGGRDIGAWIAFYDDWAKKTGWQRTTDWQCLGAARHARFAAPDADGRTLDLRFGPDPRGGTSGLLMVSPPASR